MTYIEFGLFVLNGDIHVFNEYPINQSDLKQLFGCSELIKMGIEGSFGTTINLSLSTFRFSKENIESFKSENRYIVFDDVCKIISLIVKGDQIDTVQYLASKAKVEKICPFHPYYGLIREYNKLWNNSAYIKDKIFGIISKDFNLSESKLLNLQYQAIENVPYQKGAFDKKRDFTVWLKETWIKEDQPQGAVFFKLLKNYLDVPDSLIVEHSLYGKGPNAPYIRYKSGNKSKKITKKTIQNKVSNFKKEENNISSST